MAHFGERGTGVGSGGQWWARSGTPAVFALRPYLPPSVLSFSISCRLSQSNWAKHNKQSAHHHVP